MTETCAFKITEDSFSFTCENEGIDEFVSLVENNEIKINVWETTFLKEDVIIFQPVSLEGLKVFKVNPIYFAKEDLPDLEKLSEFTKKTIEKNFFVKAILEIDDKRIKWLTFKLSSI